MSTLRVALGIYMLVYCTIRARAPDNFQVQRVITPLLLKMMGICIFPLHCCTLYFRKDCLHVHFENYA
jgi:hypothetical protein